MIYFIENNLVLMTEIETYQIKISCYIRYAPRNI